MILLPALFVQLAASCAPSVHVDTLAAIAKTESGLNTLAIGDNTTHQSYAPASTQEAVATAMTLLTRGHSIDLGLMQINNANLARLDLSINDVFEPCKNLAGGARILVSGYQPIEGSDAQPALYRALSRYNTGDPGRGFANGYVRRVQASAEVIVPAIRVQGSAAPPVAAPGSDLPPVVMQRLPPPPASWDVYGQARISRDRTIATSHGVSPQNVVTMPSPAQASQAPAEAMILQRVPSSQALNEFR